MALSNYFKPITILAAILGLVQSIIWFVLSLLGVLAYRCALNTPEYKSASDQFPVTLFALYFEAPNSNCERVNTSTYLPDLKLHDMNTLKPEDLHGWMGSYLAFDALYFIICAFILIYRNNTGRRLLFLVRVWCVVTLAFLIMDVWLTFEFGFDYQDVSDYLEDHKKSDQYGWITSIPGALMAISARGFVLWFMNLALLIYFLSYSINWTVLCNPPKKKQERRREELRGRDNDAVLNDPEFRDILQAHRSRLPRASVDSWSSDRHRNDFAIVPVAHEIKKPTRQFDNPVSVGRWEEYPSAHEGVTRFSTDDIRSFPPPKKQIIWDGEPLPKPPENRFRSHGPATSSDYRANLKEHLKSATERRQREAPLNFEEDDHRVVRPNRNSDFNHDIRNFESGQKKNGQNRESKPFGQPVRVPQPPALPKNNDAYYY